jgi:glycosyltransferase involved in cell wall biosynthesis
MRREIASFSRTPVVSIAMPVFNTPEALLRRSIESVIGQVYPAWELCIADDASTNPQVRSILQAYAKRDARIKVTFRKDNGHISAATNSAFDMATGEFIALLDHDDELAPHALYMVALELQRYPDAHIIYSDEDKIDEQGKRFDPHFKPDWNPDLFLSQNYISHLGVYRAEVVRDVGGMREGLEGSQDYDLCLRCAAKSDANQIRHIPHVLYHWRAIRGSTALAVEEKSYPEQAAIRALEDHLKSIDPRIAVETGTVPTTYRIVYPLPDTSPLVSLIVPTRNGYRILKQAVDSILKKTIYPNYEIVIVDNQSDDSETLEYMRRLEQHGNIRVLRYDHPFNFSAINNFAVRQSHGELVGLINNDVEVIEPGWLDEMVRHALRSGVGAVGAKLLYGNGQVQQAGIVLGIGGVAGHGHKHFPRHSHGYFSRLDLVHNVGGVTAACLLVRKSTYDAVGGLNERALKVAFNDVDFCLRLLDAGYRNVWTPYALLYHHESISRGPEDTPEKQARFRAEVEWMQKHWGPRLLQDPAYNPNLTLEQEDFSLAVPPRVAFPWRRIAETGEAA